jgi:hypothetical protein
MKNGVDRSATQWECMVTVKDSSLKMHEMMPVEETATGSVHG